MENLKHQSVKSRVEYQILKLEEKVLVMTQFLSHMGQKKHLGKFYLRKNIRSTIDTKLFKKLKNFYKLTIFNFVEI